MIIASPLAKATFDYGVAQQTVVKLNIDHIDIKSIKNSLYDANRLPRHEGREAQDRHGDLQRRDPRRSRRRRTHDDLLDMGKSTGRQELWEFLKNFGLVGGLVYVKMDPGSSSQKIRNSYGVQR